MMQTEDTGTAGCEQDDGPEVSKFKSEFERTWYRKVRQHVLETQDPRLKVRLASHSDFVLKSELIMDSKMSMCLCK